MAVPYNQTSLLVDNYSNHCHKNFTELIVVNKHVLSCLSIFIVKFNLNHIYI